MPVYKRGDIYWFHFWFNGQHVQRSTKQGSKTIAKQIEAAYRTQLAKDEVGLFERKPVPTLREFAPRFMEEIRVKCAAKPATVEFYDSKLKALLRHEQLANAKLNRVDEQLISRYVQWKREKAQPATVNRTLATLRRMLRLAHEWKLLDRVPRIRMLSGEHCREFVLSRQLQPAYLESAPEPLRSIARFSLESGLRIGEVLALRKEHVHLLPVGDAKRGFVHIENGKSKNAKRNVSLTESARNTLASWLQKSDAEFVFVREDGISRLSRSTLDHQHARIRKSMGLPADFVIHSFRHTALTRLGEAGADAFTIMRIAGHSTITVSQRYVHPTPETLESAFDRLETLNRKAPGLLSSERISTAVATLPATVNEVDDSVVV